MLRIGSVVIRVDDLEREAAFWEAALGYQRRDMGADDFLLLKPLDGAGPNVSLDRVPAMGQVPPKLHLDLYTEEVANARIWAGFHYRFSTRVGTGMGNQIGDYVVKNALQPIAAASR